jgi:beta-galactosidase
VYSITLCFVEYVSRNRQNSLMFDLSAGDSPESAAESRVFDVSINGTKVLDNLNLERDYGSLQAVTFDFTIPADNGNGIQLDFTPVTGEALLSGIRIRNLNR